MKIPVPILETPIKVKVLVPILETPEKVKIPVPILVFNSEPERIVLMPKAYLGYQSLIDQ